MCGRYGQTNTDKEKIKKRFRLKEINFDLVPRYNIAPGQDVPIILNETKQELTMARWGLIPFWAKEEKIGYKMINARAETITEKPSYRSAIKKKRCLILADGFYEWKKTNGTKQPYRIYMKDEELFAFAGIWDYWAKDDKHIISCSIITTNPNKLLKPIHDRMPVILPKEKEEAWLSDISIDDAVALLKPHDDKSMCAIEISTLVNSPKNNTAEVLKAVGS